MSRFILPLLILSVLSGKATAEQLPNVVLEFFKSFKESQSEENKLPFNDVQSTQYAQWFFEGFTHPTGGIFTKSDVMRDAYTKGQAYWREHPSGRAEIFVSYGYLAIERDGIFSRGFEKSAFQTNDSSVGLWWMRSLGDVAWRDIGFEPLGFTPSRLHIVGYLSPKGRFGHMGAYEHEVLVTSAMLVEAPVP